MQVSLMGMCELAEYECIALKCYLDSGGVKTFGVGSTVSDIPDIDKWDWETEHELQEAVNIYVYGLSKYSNAVNKMLKVTVKQNEFDALVSLCYNIGYGQKGLAGSTAIKLINSKAPVKMIINAMARWRNDNGKIVQGLINRRAKEAKLYQDAYYGTEGYVSLVPVRNKKPRYGEAKKVNLIPYLEKSLNQGVSLPFKSSIINPGLTIITPPSLAYTYNLNNVTTDDIQGFIKLVWSTFVKSEK